MKYIIFILLCLFTFLSVGCQQQNTNSPLLITSEQIKLLSEQDILALSEQACAETDKKAIISSDSHALNQRLNNVAESLPRQVNNIRINYKVYLNSEPNAWSTGNGCIRVNSGLLKLLTDNELQAVLAHEQAHIALKHTINSFKQAPYIEITNKAYETVIILKEEIAQQYEIDADNYAFELLIKENIDPTGLVNMLAKIPIHSKSQPSSHPATIKRISNLLEKLGKKHY